MKIFIISNASFYNKISPIKEYLENKGFEMLMPNTYDTPNLEKELFKISEEKIKTVEAVLCINFEKNNIENYIVGSTFIEIYEAFKNNKKIYLYHDIPKGILYDGIAGFEPIIINGNLDLIG